MASENNKRIAKNTLFLYFRMLLIMGVTLYTSRVILAALGVVDFGIYNVVGGVVAMFSMLSGSLSIAITRFLTYELGTGNIERLKNIFSSAITIQLLIGGLVVLLAETVGLWFLNSKMVIPHERILAANYVLQFSLITFLINLISVPYNAAIIAHEKMSAFAYISIVEAISKLSVAFLISVAPFDRLIFYAILMCVTALVIRLIYGCYCKRYFEECTYHFLFDKPLLKQMFSFAGWNYIGSAAGLLKDQGVNVVINLFCGASVNAARGIAMQVNTAVSSFINNFIMALNPQITKSYAEGNKEYMNKLVLRGTRFSYYLLFCLSVPLLFNTEYILSLWLHTVPEYSVEFVQLVLILSLSDSLYRPLLTAHLATGHIKELQIIVGGLNMLILPLSYLSLYYGYNPTLTFWISIIFSVIGLFVRIYLYQRIEKFDVRLFLKEVVINVLLVTILCIAFAWLIQSNLRDSTSIMYFILSSIIYFLLAAGICICVGLDKKEKYYIIQKIKNKLWE